MANREIPTSISEWRRNRPADPREAKDWPEGALRETTFTRRPETPIEALLETTPGETPETSTQEIAELREAIIDAIDDLPPRLRFVIDALNSERLSLQQLARRMNISKTHAHRLREQAYEMMREALAHNTHVRRRLSMDPQNWQEAALAVVTELEPTGDRADDELNTIIATCMAELVHRFNTDPDAQQPETYQRQARAMGRAASGWLANHGCWNTDDIHALLCRKQRDYGHGNINAFGARGVIVRLNDKIERMRNLTFRNVNPSNESLIDTYDDIVGYCTIIMMLANNTFNLEYQYEYQG